MFKNSRLFAPSFSFLLLSLATWTTTLFAQDSNQSSPQEVAAIKSVESAGGRVYRISAADGSREISFNLSSKPIGDEHLKGINSISEVVWLNLAGTQISNEGLKQLIGMPLKKLHLERTKIGDAGLKHLKTLKDLEYLNLYNTEVTDAGIEHLKALKNLKKLYVWKSGVTEDGISKLNQLLPDAQIVGALKLEPAVIEEPEKAKPDKAKKADAGKNGTAKVDKKKKRAEDKAKAEKKKQAGDKDK